MWLAAKRTAAPTLLVCLAIYFASWMLLPIALTLGLWERVFRPLPMDRGVYMAYASIECVCFLAVVLLFGVVNGPFPWITHVRVAQWIPSKGIEALFVAIAAFTDLAARQALLGGSYEENNAMMHLTSALLARMNIIILIDSLLCAFLYATIVRGGRSRLTTVMAWTWIFIATAQWLTTGQRVVLLMPCVMLLLWIHEHAVSRKTLAIGYGAIALFLGTIGILAMLVIAEIRGAKRMELEDAARATTTIVARPVHTLAWNVAQHLQIKFDAISAGAALVEKHGRGSAGMRPYEGALLALVPRMIAPGKPVPGSGDGTMAGIPARLAAASLGFDPRFVNVGVNPSAIELWHFGAAGLLLLVILNVLQLTFINTLLTCRGIVPRTLAMFLLGLPLCVTLYASGDVIVMNMQRVLVLYALAALAALIVLRGSDSAP